MAPFRGQAIRVIDAEQARPLRHRVLRPEQPIEACIYETDSDPASAHFGAVHEGVLVGIASIYPQAPEGPRDLSQWRLRGMATLEEVRGEGFGAALLETCIRHARDQGGLRMWCNGRTTVADFYGRFGFQVVSEVFDLPGIGPHVRMAREL